MLCHQYSKFHLEIQQTRRVGVWGLTKRISLRNSTDRASWGSGPQQRISLRNSTDRASWGSGPQQKNFTEKFNRQGKLGFDGGLEFKMHFVLLFEFK